MPKILVVDDEPHIREVVRRFLTTEGYDVIEAEDGGAALEKALKELPDIVLLDLTMPVMDGFEVLRDLRETPSTQNIPVILLTAVDAAEGERTGMELGVEHYIAKPLEPGIVKATIKVVLRGSKVANTSIKVGNLRLDESLGGGIPLGSLTLIEGTSSAGKSVLCQHLMFGALQDGHQVACFTSEDSVKSLMTQMGSIGLNVSRYVRTGNLQVFPLYEPKPDEDYSALLASLAEEMEGLPRQNKLIAVDSITNLASVSHENAVLGFFSRCKRLCSNGKTIFLVGHSFAIDERMLVRLGSLCDAHLRLSVENIGERQVRVMEVSKVRNASQATGNIVRFEVEPGYGMKIIPISKARA